MAKMYSYYAFEYVLEIEVQLWRFQAVWYFLKQIVRMYCVVMLKKNKQKKTLFVLPLLYILKACLQTSLCCASQVLWD